MKNPTLLSVCLITYNHREFIAQAIDSVLMQKTDFNFELIIADDCSTDGTREIIKEYQKEHPDLIRLILQKENVGPARNWIELISAPKSKYIAYFEGDDYWIDPLKLQKQVDFLEVNAGYGICFHNVLQDNEFDSDKNWVIPDIKTDIDYTIEDYILLNRTATCSILYKREYIEIIPDWLENAAFGDLALILIILFNSNGKGRVLKDTMGVYRIHNNGIHGKLQRNNRGLIQAYLQHIQFANLITKKLLEDKRFRIVISRKMFQTCELLSKLYKAEYNVFNYVKYVFLRKYYGIKIKLIE